MSDYVRNNTPASSFPKQDRSISTNPVKDLPAADWNTLCQSVTDLKGFIYGADFLGFVPASSLTAPAGAVKDAIWKHVNSGMRVSHSDGTTDFIPYATHFDVRFYGASGVPLSGVTGSITSGQNLLTVSSISGIKIGNYVGVTDGAANGYRGKVTAINGLVLTMSGNAAHTFVSGTVQHDAQLGIQAACDAAHAAGGGIVKLPRGTFILGTPFEINCLPIQLDSHVWLEGAGKEATTIIACDEMRQFLPANASDYNITLVCNRHMSGMNGNAHFQSEPIDTNIVVRDLTLDGNAINQFQAGAPLAYYNYQGTPGQVSGSDPGSVHDAAGTLIQGNTYHVVVEFAGFNQEGIIPWSARNIKVNTGGNHNAVTINVPTTNAPFTGEFLNVYTKLVDATGGGTPDVFDPNGRAGYCLYRLKYTGQTSIIVTKHFQGLCWAYPKFRHILSRGVAFGGAITSGGSLTAGTYNCTVLAFDQTGHCFGTQESLVFTVDGSTTTAVQLKISSVIPEGATQVYLCTHQQGVDPTFSTAEGGSEPYFYMNPTPVIIDNTNTVENPIVTITTHVAPTSMTGTLLTNVYLNASYIVNALFDNADHVLIDRVNIKNSALDGVLFSTSTGYKTTDCRLRDSFVTNCARDALSVTGAAKDIFFENVYMAQCQHGCDIEPAGFPDLPIDNVVFENCTFFGMEDEALALGPSSGATATWTDAGNNVTIEAAEFGAWGNFTQVQIDTASDANSGHYNLNVKDLDANVYTYHNVVPGVGYNNTAVDLYDKQIRIRGLTSTRPTNTSYAFLSDGVTDNNAGAANSGIITNSNFHNIKVIRCRFECVETGVRISVSAISEDTLIQDCEFREITNVTINIGGGGIQSGRIIGNCFYGEAAGDAGYGNYPVTQQGSTDGGTLFLGKFSQGWIITENRFKSVANQTPNVKFGKGAINNVFAFNRFETNHLYPVLTDWVWFEDGIDKNTVHSNVGFGLYRTGVAADDMNIVHNRTTLGQEYTTAEGLGQPLARFRNDLFGRGISANGLTSKTITFSPSMGAGAAYSVQFRPQFDAGSAWYVPNAGTSVTIHWTNTGGSSDVFDYDVIV